MNKDLESRYKPGKRRNSFYMDMTKAKTKRTGTSSLGEYKVSGYTYHMDGSTGALIREYLQ